MTAPKGLPWTTRPMANGDVMVVGANGECIARFYSGQRGREPVSSAEAAANAELAVTAPYAENTA